MKKINILCMIFIAMIFIPTASSTELPTVVISDYQLSPEVFMPGDIGTLSITLTNTARVATETETKTVVETRLGSTETVTDTKTIDLNAIIEDIKLSGNGLEVINDKFRRVGSLGPGQSKRISFEIKAPRREGIFFPLVRIDMRHAENIRFPIPVHVIDGSVNIAVNTPPIILMEETAKININILNTLPSSVNSVYITPTYNYKDFDVYPSKIFIGQMRSNEIRNVSFDIFSRNIGIKNIDFELSFRNGIHNIHTESKAIQLEVSNHPSVRLIATSYPKSIVRGEVAKIEFDVINDRLSRVSGVRVVPIGTNVPIMPSESFIGAMKSDDTFSARFNLNTENLPLNQTEIGFKVEFRDMDGRLFESDTYLISIKVTENVAEPISPMIPLIVISVIVLALIVGFFIYKRKQRNP